MELKISLESQVTSVLKDIFDEELHMISTSDIKRICPERVEFESFHVRDVKLFFFVRDQVFEQVSGIVS